MRKIIIREVDKTKLHYMVDACERYKMSLAGINVAATTLRSENDTSMATHIFCSYKIEKFITEETLNSRVYWHICNVNLCAAQPSDIMYVGCAIC